MCRCKRERAGQPGVFGLNEIAMNGNTFAAPWGKSLRFMSWFSAALGLIIPGAVYLADKNGHANWLPVACLYWGIMFITALFVVRSYTLEPNALLIQRLWWVTRLPLAGLQSATFQPKVMRGSLRLFGNGGMFSITGWYRNRALGNYRAYVTELNNTVVLRFAKKTIVVSPDNPEAFAAEISNRKW
jgi:hypothetical protein